MRINPETSVGLLILSGIVVFLFMSYYVGIIRLDTLTYNNYRVFLRDSGGLANRSDVLIAGVRVGWVDSLNVVNNGEQVEAVLMISKEFVLYADARCGVRQDGIIGRRYLEVMPGSSTLPRLQSGDVFKHEDDRASFESILQSALATSEQLREALKSVKDVALAPETRATVRNWQSSISTILHELTNSAQGVTTIVNNAQEPLAKTFTSAAHIAGTLQEQLPSFLQSLDLFAAGAKDDIASVTKAAVNTIEDIKTRQGVVGKLVYDAQLGEDVAYAAESIRSYFERINTIHIFVDAHLEAMTKSIPALGFPEGKGYINLNIFPCDDYYYILGVCASYLGTVKRRLKLYEWFDNAGNRLVPDRLELSDANRLRFAAAERKITRDYDTFTINAQVARVYGPTILRVGLYESTFAIGADIWMPCWPYTNVQTKVSVDIYDFKGRHRIDDDMPHIKVWSRTYITDTAYIVAGGDDLFSKTNSSFFVGVGFTFEDCNLIYLLPRVLT